MHRPAAVVLENVEKALGAKQYALAKGLLRNAGYGLSESVLLASYYGVPQRRSRLILVGRLGERDGFLDSAISAAASPTEMSIRDAFGDKFGDGIYFHPKAYNRKAIWTTSEPAPTIRSASHKNQSNFVHKQGVDDDIEGNYYNPVLEEMPQFHGFPAWWDWSGENKTITATMIGNVVPPPLAKVIGTCIRERHEGKSIPALPDGFNDWLSARGYTPPSIRNVRTRVNSGRRLLQGRTFANSAHEIGELELALAKTKMSVRGKSDVRSSFRLHREYLDYLAAQQMAEEKRIKARRDKKRAPSAREFEKIREDIRSTFHIPRARSSSEPEFIDDPRDEAV